MKVQKCSGSLGAEISGVDLSKGVSAALARDIRDVFLQNGVIFFRDQSLSTQQYFDFALAMGEPVEYPFVKGLDGFPKVIEVKKLEHERHNFGGIWHSDTTYLAQPPMGSMLYAQVLPPYGGLFAWLEGKAPRPDPQSAPIFRPLMLAHPLEAADIAALDPAQYRAEWKWDGIRVQITAGPGGCRLWSRGAEDISASFPEIMAVLDFHGVLDGELLVVRDGQVAPFADVQQRLNRKSVTARMQREFPVAIRLYDMLFEGPEDLRPLPFTTRRARLESWHQRQQPQRMDLSETISFTRFEDLQALRDSARAAAIEGLMLKRADGPYLSGRVKGEWWKWKRAPLTLDTVLMYAQRGHGKRSSFYSDYTFGVWRADGELVPIGKAYSGYTDEELAWLDRWIRNHTVDRFGPVREVEKQLVLEVAFDAAQRSSRHKSGVALRFPRIARIRRDKPAEEADRLEAALALIAAD